MAEAPPASLDRYFYFTDVRAHDSLFRHVAGEMLRREPSRENKAELLRLLQDAGVFLIALKLDSMDGSPLASHVPSLIGRVRRLEPHKIILIKATVYDAAYRPLCDAGFPVADVRVPYPGSGQQARFREAFRTAQRKRTLGSRTASALSRPACPWRSRSAWRTRRGACRAPSPQPSPVLR